MSPSRIAQAVLFLVVSLLPVLAGPSARAATWYVTPTGDDTADCQTPATPCLTINGAIGKAADGDIILVSEGTYSVTSGDEVVFLKWRSLTLSGGWDAGFAAQGGTSVIDGGGVRRGIFVDGGAGVNIDHFTVEHGFNSREGGGMFIHSATVTMDKCLIANNVSLEGGGGILSQGSTLTLRNSTVSANVTGNPSWCSYGGAIFAPATTLTLDNTTVSGNAVIGRCEVSGVHLLGGSLEVNNSTISGNYGVNGNAIKASGGSVTLRNATISFNEGAGLLNTYSASISLQNSIIAGNGAGVDCFNDRVYPGTFISGGYNLIGNGEGCPITASPGDQIGSSATPINPMLLPLGNNGGMTATHALRSGSPALNAGNPAVPGSGGSACLATDQRGQPRPQGIACDIGAFEGFFTSVASIRRVGPNPTNATSVDFTVAFSEPVSGVDTAAPFGDFALTTTGVTTGEISAVSGYGDTYTVTVSLDAHSGNGTIRLDIRDDDSIIDGLGNPLGGTGIGNGDFTLGERYTVLTIPPPLSPAGKITTAKPTYRWTKVPGATQYQYQLLKGSKVVSTRSVSSAACGSTTCAHAPTTMLGMGSHKWRVQAMLGGAWMSYSAYKPFTVSPKAGYWGGYGLEFYVTPDLASVDNFAIYISVTGCGSYKITHLPLVRIANINGRFAFGGSFYASGTFSSPTRVSGQLGLNMFYIPGCGYLKGGPFSWSGSWKNPSQPKLAGAADSDPISVAPLPGLPDGVFSFEPAGP